MVRESIDPNRCIALPQRDVRRLKMSGSAFSKTSSIPLPVNAVPAFNQAGGVSKWERVVDLWLCG